MRLPDPIRDLLLSLSPAAWRRKHPPECPSLVLKAATWGGLLQFVLFGLFSVLRYRAYLAHRIVQLSQYLRGAGEVTQAGGVVFLTVEYFFYPASLLLAYFAVEGFARFAAGLITSEVFPTLPLFLTEKVISHRAKLIRERELSALPADQRERLADGRIIIASSLEKTTWNDTVTIVVEGGWYQVEENRRGKAPRPFEYVLAPCTEGRVLRRMEEYPPAAIDAKT